MRLLARSLTMVIVAGAAALARPNAPATGDTIVLEVGSPQVDGRVFKPHAALVPIYHGDTLVAEWLNELTLGDSAGRRVMRWVTTSHPVASNPTRTLSVLRQTYDAATLAPLGYSSTNSVAA